MSHSLHRYGSEESLKNDFCLYARASRNINREGAGPKFRKILEIMRSENVVNFGSSHAGKSLKGGLDPEKYKDTLDNSYGIICTFSEREALKNVLSKLKEANTGISIVVSGLISEIKEISEEVGLKVHTATLSLGIYGKKALLPKDNILEITTMCGHSLVASSNVKEVMKDIAKGRLTAEEGAQLLAQACPCGIFNTDRCTELLKKRS